MCAKLKILRKDRLATCLRLVLGFIFVCSFHETQGKQEILTLPVFYMKVYYTPGDATNPPTTGLEEKYKTVTPEHVRLNEKWTIEETYSKTLKEIETTVLLDVRYSTFKMFSLNLSSTWLYDVSPNAIKGTLLEEMRDQSSGESRKIPYSKIQKELLKVVSAKFRVDLNQIAANLQATAENLSLTYDPNNWEAVVHTIVKESVDAHAQLLQLASNESLAQLVQMSMADLYNASLSEFDSKIFSLYPRKTLLSNKTSSLLSSFNLSVQSESITIANLAYMVSSFTPQDLRLLFQLNTEQVRTIDRSTFIQISHMCPGYTVTDLLDRSPINVSWIIAGTKYEASRCPILVVVKGKSIKTIKQSTPINVTDMSVLEILTVSSALPWREVFWAVSTSMTEWEISDSVKLVELAFLSGINENLIEDDSVSYAIDLIYTLKNNGSLNSTIEAEREKVRNSLEKLLNISTSAVATYTSTSEEDLHKASSSQLVTKFIQATVSHFEINVADINNTLQLTMEQLYNLPRHEWQQIVAPIVDAVVKLQAGILRMNVENMYTFLEISSNSTTVEQVNVLIATKIKPMIAIINKFVNVTIKTWLTESATQDAVYSEMTILDAVLNATGFSEKGISLVYDLNEGQMTVMKKVTIMKLVSYCNISRAETKSFTPFNLTSFVVGIQTIKPTCRATAFYVSYQVETITVSKGEITVLTNTTASLVELMEYATGLPWRMSAPLLGLHVTDWTVLDAIALSNIPQKTVAQVETMTFEQLVDHSLQLNSSGALDSIVQSFNVATKSEMYQLFNTNDDEISTLLKITQSQITKSSINGLFQFVLDSFYKKFDVSLHTVAASIGVKASDLSYLAPTEWHEILPSLRDQIVKNAQVKLEFDRKTFLLLVQETNLSSKRLIQLESIWDDYVDRFLKSKTVTEGKSISMILQEQGQSFPTTKTLMDFVNDNLNVTAAEFSLLFDFDQEAISVLENYTLTEIPSSCRMTQNEMLSKSPLNLTKAMIGYGDIITCRPVALVTALRTVTIERLAFNFSIAINDTLTMLEFWRKEITVSWIKLLWGFSLPLDEWPLVGALSLTNYSSLVGLPLSDIKSNMTYAQIAREVRSRSVDSYLDAYRQTLLSRTLEMFTVTSNEICSDVSSPCTTKIIDIFQKTLSILGRKINFDPSSLAGKLGVTSYEFQVLVPFQWHKTVPYIISESYQRLSSSLNMTQDRLSVLLESSVKMILNMSLDVYVPIVLNQIKPLVRTKTEMESMTLAELAKARDIDVESLQNKTGIEIIRAVFDTSLLNISFIFDWNSQFIAGLQNYTLFQSSRKMKDNDLSSDRSFANLLSLMATVVPNYTPFPLTCKSGYELYEDKSKCIDFDECSQHQDDCPEHSECVNTPGSFLCKCSSGFDDLSGDGRDCKASFLKTMWWIIIVIVCVVVVLIIIFLILRKPKFNRVRPN